MAPRGYDRYMVVVGMGAHPKFGHLSDAEFRAHVVGVLAVAARAPVRGCLMVGKMPAGAEHVAAAAGVPLKVAASAMAKLEAVGVLFRDEEHGCLRVHDWEDVNPPPKTDRTNADRQRKFRNGHNNAASNDTRNAVRNAAVTPDVTGTEVEVEVEVTASTTSQQVARKRARQRVDQTNPPDGFPEDLLPVLQDALGLLYPAWDLRGGVEPQERGVGLAIMRNPRADHRAVARKLVHWLTAGTGQRAQCRDIAARFGDWVEQENAALKVLDGGQASRPAALERADAWQRGYEEGA